MRQEKYRGSQESEQDVLGAVRDRVVVDPQNEVPPISTEYRPFRICSSFARPVSHS